MDDQRFEQLINRLEISAQERPTNYAVAVVGVALLGFLVLALVLGMSLLSVGLLIGLVALVVVSGGKAMIVLLKLGKLVILLALPAWTMLKASFTLLFSRFPKPEGRELKRAEAPVLFARLDQLRERMKGPRVHKVLLTDELNASIVQHPRFGLFGWEENYLILGLPLLQTLSEEETFAVVAHEYGHLSGHHSRLGGFIYRFRTAWGRMQHLSEQWNDWGSRLIARLFRWYAPYFNAYTFVLARQNEYIADRSSVEMAGQQHAANALMRVSIAAQFEDKEFWPSINRRVAKEPEPFDSRSGYWSQAMRSILNADMRERFIEEECKRKTDHFDTHPALTDRLAAMGVTVDLAAARALEAPAVSAAQAWLGNGLDAIRQEFDRAWQKNVADNWHKRHEHLKAQQARLEELEAKAELDGEEQWERIDILSEVTPDFDTMPLLDALLQQIPEHASALFRRGRLLLEQGNEAGIADLEAVMAKDLDSILAGCELAWRFYKERDAARAEEYSRRWQERNDYLEQVRAEISNLRPDATLAEPDLGEEALEHVRAILRSNGKYVRKAYVLRRVLKSDASIPDYVLAVETSWFTLGNKGEEVVKRLAAQEFPAHFFVVHLGSEPFKRFRKQIKRMKLEPLQY